MGKGKNISLEREECFVGNERPVILKCKAYYLLERTVMLCCTTGGEYVMERSGWPVLERRRSFLGKGAYTHAHTHLDVIV